MAVFKPPPESYELDNLIVDISEKITREELQELKERFTVIKHVETPKEMLHCLRHHEFISRYNIMYIQQIVRVLGREELIEILEKYIQVFEEDKVLHFVQTSTETAVGYRIVQFHILGHGLLETNQLEDLRIGVSRLLLCPLYEVIVKGIQATNSTLFTFTIPTVYVEFLTKQLKKHSQRFIKSFMQMDVEIVIFGEDEYLLQKEGDIYKVKKIYNERDTIKDVKTVCKATKAGEENQQTTKHGSTMNNKCQQKQSQPTNILKQCVEPVK